jgi:hypothetical protein
MQRTIEHRAILQENRVHGWSEVDETCPPHIAARIIEFRCKKLRIPVPSTSKDDVLADARMKASLGL